MKIVDVLYGEFEIDDLVLIKLINSKPVQRLKGISQFGVPHKYYLFPDFSRFEHSIGVMLLLRKLGASPDEQIAGLLHDVSHTAFSHVIDWVFDSREKENYQDNNHSNVIFNSEIPKILLNNGFTAEKIIDTKRYCLLEKEIPDLCADRLDYALREFYYWVDKEAFMTCLENIEVFEGRIVFSSKRPALAFGKNFLKCQNFHWGSTDTVLRYHLLSEALKIALSQKIISMNDFYENDDFIVKKLEESKNPLIRRILRALSFGKIRFSQKEKNPQLRLRKKFRYVDPMYLENGELYRLSEYDQVYKNMIAEQKRINEKGINVDLLI